MTAGGFIDPEARPGRPVAAFVAIGSNLGDREAHVAHAFASLAAMPETILTGRSSVHETEPVGPAGQGPYLNAVAGLRTGLPAARLLSLLLAVERERGRERAAEVRFGPRTLDLDLLCWGDAVPGGARIESAGLQVPHPRMHEREFVLRPLAELDAALAAAARAHGIHS